MHWSMEAKLLNQLGTSYAGLFHYKKSILETIHVRKIREILNTKTTQEDNVKTAKKHWLGREKQILPHGNVV